LTTTTTTKETTIMTTSFWLELAFLVFRILAAGVAD